MIDFINTNTIFISTISTASLLFVTIVYVIVNTLMHSEMVKSREILQRADVSLRLEKIKSGFMKIVIENNTANDIYELSFTEYPEDDMTGRNGNHPGFIKEGISYMASKQSYESFFINYPYLVSNNKHKQIIRFKMKFKNVSGKLFIKEIEINLSLLYDNVYLEN